MNKDLQMALKAVIVAATGYFLYRVAKGDSPKEAAEKVTETAIKPVEAVVSVAKGATKTTANVVKDTTKSVKKLVKGSPEAKEHMRKLAAMKKKKKVNSELEREIRANPYYQTAEGKKKAEKLRKVEMSSASKSGKGSHKGHATKRGLSQDQKLDSAEKHEKSYRKGKERRLRTEAEQKASKKRGKKILEKHRKQFDGFAYADELGGEEFLIYMKKAGARAGEKTKEEIDTMYKNFRARQKTELVKVVISQAEGPTDEVDKHQNMEFKSMTEAQALIETTERPKTGGYNKWDVWLHYSDGKIIKHRYDHGHNDPKLMEQIKT